MGADVAIRTAGVDVLGRATVPVKPEDQPIRMILVIVVGKPQREPSHSAAALNRDISAFAGAHVLPRFAGHGCKHQRRGLAAASALCGGAGCGPAPASAVADTAGCSRSACQSGS